jgi:transposase-like protein
VVRFSEEDRKTIWDMREAGVPVKRIAKHLGRQNSSLRKFIADAGGRRPSARERCELRLSLEEREEISRGLAVDRSLLDRYAERVTDPFLAFGGRRQASPQPFEERGLWTRTTRLELSSAIFDWIEAFYNRVRRHSALGMLSPIAYEKLHSEHTCAA